MNTKAIKRVLASTLATVMSVSVMPMTALAATSVKPVPAQENAENILVEYFPTTFIDYDQVKTNQRSQNRDYVYDEIDPITWGALKYRYNQERKDPTGPDSGPFYIHRLADDGYYMIDISYVNTADGTMTYKLYYQWTDEATSVYRDNGGEFVGFITATGPAGENGIRSQYPTDNNGIVETFGEDNKIQLYQKSIKETIVNDDNTKTYLYNYYQNGFYFTTDKGGKPDDTDDIPLFSAGWGKDKVKDNSFDYDFDGDGETEEDPNDAAQDQDFYIYSGLAADKLSESTNAPFAKDVNAAPGFFSTDENVGTDYRTVYTNVKVPYVYDPATGNYTLDADKNGVYFPGGVGESDATMLIADAASGMYVNGDAGDNGDGDYVTGLVPFAEPGEFIPKDESNGKPALISGQNTYAEGERERTDSYKVKVPENKEENDKAKEALFAFGMVTEVKFQMTDDGMSPVNGDHIKFHFAGDDDVWVYIDGVLALDIGGVHDRIDGDIDFVTGDVKVSAPISRLGIVGDRVDFVTMNNHEVVNEYDNKNNTKYQKTYDDENKKNVYYINQGNIYEKLGTTLTGFAAQGEHTLTIYYMERGEGKNNCFIQFNLPQSDTVEVTKKFDSVKDNGGNISSIPADVLEKYGAHEFGFTLEEDGQPVANKTYYVYDENNTLLSTASTNAEGHFILKRNETARFLVDIWEDNSFQVIEEKEKGFEFPKWSYTTNITDASETEKANGFNGMTVTATGSNTVADNISFVCENYLSLNNDSVSIIPQGERIVIDYGLPITIQVSDLLKNDIITGDKISVELTDQTGTYGTAVYDGKKTDDVSDDTITYTLNKQLIGIETLTYKITVTADNNVGDETSVNTISETADILIMPATSMYYEENFGGAGVEDEKEQCIKYGLVSYSDQTTKWELVENAKGGNQETGFVGTVDDSTYGSDVVYMNHTGDSYGTSMHASTTDAAAMFEYDFTGTGTAIYGRVSPNTGYIRVKITDEDGNVADWQYIDTVEINSVGEENMLYNIPIYINTNLAKDVAETGDETGEVSELAEVTTSEVGNYHVEVLVYKKGTPTNRKDGSGADFYLDGIRIYNPILNDNTVNTAYSDDGEANTVVLNIREKIKADVEDGKVINDNVFTLTDQYGEAITNADYNNGDADYKNYVDYGPNNEFYLNADTTTEENENRVYTISFKLINWDSQRYQLYLGMKAPAGEASVKVGNQTINLKNSTECYYDISEYIYVATEDGVSLATVTISGNEGLASLTNLKVTGTEAFVLITPPSEDIEADGVSEEEDETTPETETEIDPESGARVLYIVPATLSLSEDSGATIPDKDETVFEETEFNDTESDPDENIPEENETDGETTEDTDEVENDPIPGDSIEGEVDTDKDKIDIEIVPSDKVEIEIIPDDEDAADAEFTPDLFRTDCSYKSRLKTATISVMTSTDASYITIDGKKVSGTKVGNVRIYLDIRTRINSGTSFEIIAYDKDGNASEVYTVTAE